jgi:hypothetical protein
MILFLALTSTTLAQFDAVGERTPGHVGAYSITLAADSLEEQDVHLCNLSPGTVLDRAIVITTGWKLTNTATLVLMPSEEVLEEISVSETGLAVSTFTPRTAFSEGSYLVLRIASPSTAEGSMKILVVVL